jgi:hypothetical protein
VKNTEDTNKITFLSKDVVKEIYNQDKTLLLILKYKVDGNLPTTFNYKVIDVKTKEEKKEGIFIGSKIEWQDNKSLKCTKHIGMVKKDDENLLTGEKTETTKNYIVITINK